MTDKVTPFTEETTTPAPAESTTTTQTKSQEINQTPAFVLPDSVKDMVGEGKKYATVEAALSALVPSQEHIARIEAENAQYRADLAKAKATEDVLAEIKAAAQSKETTTTVSAPQMDAEAIAQMVDQRLQATEAKKIVDQNTRTVIDSMVKHFGDATKADEAYQKKAEELGLGLTGLNQLVASSPKAVLHLFGLDKTESQEVGKTSSSVNTEALNMNTPPPKPIGSVMGGTTAKQAVEAWRAMAPKTT